MDDNKIIERMRDRGQTAEQMARERIRVWFEQNDRPLAIIRQSRRRKIWMLVVAVLCSGVLFRSHASVMQALSIIHSRLGV